MPEGSQNVQLLNKKAFCVVFIISFVCLLFYPWVVTSTQKRFSEHIVFTQMTAVCVTYMASLQGVLKEVMNLLSVQKYYKSPRTVWFQWVGTHSNSETFLGTESAWVCKFTGICFYPVVRMCVMHGEETSNCLPCSADDIFKIVF